MDADEQKVVVVVEQLERRVADRPDRDQGGLGVGVAGDVERADLVAAEVRAELRRDRPRSADVRSSIASATWRWNAE